MSRLKQYYQETVIGKLQQALNCANVMQVPKISKITVNMGVGKAAEDKKIIANAMRDLTQLTGQKPIVCKAKKSVAGFKIREGWPIGCKVTLRKGRMYEFLDRLIAIVLPRVRDFRGLSKKAFDGQGNYSLGISEQIVFPEIHYDKIDVLRGLDITITTTAKTDKEGLALLSAFKFPFKDDGTKI